MIRVYFLPVERDSVTNTEYVKGSDYISHAIIKTTEEPNVRRVIIEKNSHLEELALRVEEPTMQDLDDYNFLPELSLPARNFGDEIDSLRDRIEGLEKLKEDRKGDKHGVE